MRSLTALLYLFSLPLVAAAQPKNITGIWQGKLHAGVDIPLVFHFTQAATGELTGTMDSPAQHVTGLQLSSVTINGDSLTAELKAAHAVYKAVATGDSTFTGTWQQGGASFALVITHVAQASVAAEVKRPQTPAPPFAYNSQEVEYDNADKTIHFGATLTYPTTGGPFTTVLLITGSGAQDRDETILGHKPFAVLADYLTQKGYAVLRVDDRGVGKTTGSMQQATSADFAKDVEAGIAYLKTRPEVNKQKIGLLGHSEGGVIAPMVAAGDKTISFIILWGGPVAGGLKTNTEQNALALQKAGISADAVTAFKQLHTQALELFKTAKDVTALNAAVKPVFDAWRQQQPANILKSLMVTDSTIIGRSIFTIYDGLYNLPWMRFFISHNFAADLAKVHCPVLAINGQLDTQVDAAENLGLIDSILKKHNKQVYTVLPLKGLNHLLQTAVTGDAGEYEKINETIAPAALDAIGNWMDAHVK